PHAARVIACYGRGRSRGGSSLRCVMSMATRPPIEAVRGSHSIPRNKESRIIIPVTSQVCSGSPEAALPIFVSRPLFHLSPLCFTKQEKINSRRLPQPPKERKRTKFFRVAGCFPTTATYLL